MRNGESSNLCQYHYKELVSVTSSDVGSVVSLIKYWRTLKRCVWYASVLGLRGFASILIPRTRIGGIAFGQKRSACRLGGNFETLDLQPGEWVEVRSAEEIFDTLDERGKLKGLGFNLEMIEFCGRRFKVYKRVNRIIMESRALEGVFCDGKLHDECDRSCFCFWREAWLKRISAIPQKKQD